MNGVPTVSIDGGDRTEYKRTDSAARSFDVTATVGTDPDGHTLSYTWLVRRVGSNDAPTGVSIAKDSTDPKEAEVTISNAVAGAAGTDYQIFLTVRDSQSATTTDAITMKVKDNNAPSVTINNQSGTNSKDITGAGWWREYRQASPSATPKTTRIPASLAVTLNPGDGSQMAFTDGGTGNCSPKIEIRETKPGDYKVRVTVTDSIGDSATDTMDIEVQ